MTILCAWTKVGKYSTFIPFLKNQNIKRTWHSKLGEYLETPNPFMFLWDNQFNEANLKWMIIMKQAKWYEKQYQGNSANKKGNLNMPAAGCKGPIWKVRA